MNSKALMLPALAAVALFSTAALADGGAAAAADPESWKGMVGLAAGLAMAFAVLGAGLAQGLLAGKAVEGIARNPQAGGKVQIAMLMALAFPESLVIFAFLTAIFLIGKI